MAADAYVKEAAGILRRAAAQLRSEITQIQYDAKGRQRQLDKDVIGEQEEMVRMQAVAGQPEEQIQAARFVRDVADLERDIKRKKEEMSQIDREAADAVNAKESTARQLEAEAGELESLSGAPELK